MRLQLFPQDAVALRRISVPLKKIDGATHALVKALTDAMMAHQGIGMAAPQLGVHQRVFVMNVYDGKDAPNAEDTRVFINPVISEAAIDTKRYKEGCLSIPDVRAEVARPAWVRVQAIGLDGAPFDETFHGLEAVCVQHEIDHLNGQLFIDHLAKREYRRIERQIAEA